MIGEALKSSNSESLETLLELQRRDASEGPQNRAQRFGVQCEVKLEPGNSSQRDGKAWVAACNDLSSSGCRLIAGVPLQVGDIYRLSFEKSLNLPNVFARCVRCSLLRDDAFEAGLQFFSEVSLPEAGQTTPGDASDLADML